jgi:integrase
MKLHQRGNTYHLRLRVPTDLIDLFNRREIHQSLRTSDGRTARSRASTIRAKLNGGFDKLRFAKLSSVTNQDIESLATDLLVSLGGTRRVRESSTLSDKCLNLEDLIQLHLEEKKLAVDARTYMSMEYSYRLALHHIGNINLNMINRSVCRSYRDSLKATPQFLLRNDNASKCVNRLLSDKSINNHLQFLSALLRWGTREELVHGNPAEGLAIRKRLRDWNERFAYDTKQIQHLFGRLWLQESRIERRWIPLIAVYSGMRQEEICQLWQCDIITRNNILCFNITGDAGYIKSPSAERLVPIHPWLLQHGLLEHIPPTPNIIHNRLWVNLNKSSFNRYSNSICKWFSRYKRQLGFEDSRYCFHSLRHTFINEMKQNEVPEPVIRQLVGHREGSITLGRYGKDYDIEKLFKYMQMVNFEIDLIET